MTHESPKKIEASSIARALQSATIRGAAVLIPLIEDNGSWRGLLEIRAQTLDIQPGDVCLPGGHIEKDESPLEAALRETCEELLVSRDDIELLGELGCASGPGGMPLWTFVGILHNYEGSFSTDEVDEVFTIELDWLLMNDPATYSVDLTPSYPKDFPWELVHGGRGYSWRKQRNDVPFYLGTEPLVWGATARVLHRFAHTLREGGLG